MNIIGEFQIHYTHRNILFNRECLFSPTSFFSKFILSLSATLLPPRTLVARLLQLLLAQVAIPSYSADGGSLGKAPLNIFYRGGRSRDRWNSQMFARYTVLRKYASLSRLQKHLRSCTRTHARIRRYTHTHHRFTAIVFNPALQAAPGRRSSGHRRNLSCIATNVIAFRSSNRMVLVFSGIRVPFQFKRYSVCGNAANRSEDADQKAGLQSKFSFHILITHTSYQYTVLIEIGPRMVEQNFLISLRATCSPSIHVAIRFIDDLPSYQDSYEELSGDIPSSSSKSCASIIKIVRTAYVRTRNHSQRKSFEYSYPHIRLTAWNLQMLYTDAT